MPSTRRLHDLAADWGVDVIDVIKAAAIRNISYSVPEDKIRILKSAVSGYYELPERDIRTLEDFLKSEKAKGILKHAENVLPALTEDEQSQYLTGISRQLLLAMDDDDELSKRINPGTLVQTITNLGVVKIRRTGFATEQAKPLPPHLTGLEPNIAKHVVKRYLLSVMDGLPVRQAQDFSHARNNLAEEAQRLRNDYAGQNLDQVIEEAERDVKKTIAFGECLWQQSSGMVRPMMHQLVRIDAVVNNGIKRVVCGDTTGAGKTLVLVAIKGLTDARSLNEGGKKTKALIIAPNQAIDTAWSQEQVDQYTSSLPIPQQSVARMETRNLESLLQHDMVLVNFEKLSLGNAESNRYLRAMMALLPHMDAVVVDECHNFKNVASKRAKAFTEIVELTKQKRLVMLSATPVPNRIEDAGFLLYMLNPERNRHYAENRFSYPDDPYAILNARNSGAWFTFTRDDLKALFDLPELRFGDEQLGVKGAHYFELSPESAKRYLEAWENDTGNVSKVSTLSRVLLQEEFNEIERLVTLIKEKEPRAQIAIYSYYVDGFSEELKRHLASNTHWTTETITGEKTLEERLEAARRFSAGEIEVSINSISTVSEALSLATGDRPAYVIFAEPPVVPANYDQTIGRFYRKGQRAPVTVLEMLPTSNLLNQMMDKAKEEQEASGISYRRTWKPGTLFEDKHDLRLEKEEFSRRILMALSIDDLEDVGNLAEGEEDSNAYKSLPPGKEARTNKEFNDGLKRVRGFIGRPIENLTDSEEKKYLIESYSRADWERTSSADTNKAIAALIRQLGKERILDWGCGTACLARTLKRQVHNLDAMPEMIEAGKRICLEAGLYSPETANGFFHVGNAKKMPFPDSSFEIVSSSYAIQYNAQGYQHKRDIEHILLETNRVLAENGYGILALPNQATTEDDIEALTKRMLPSYGFRVVLSEFVTGHAINPETGREKKVFAGFYLIAFQKTATTTQLMSGGEDVFIYSPYKRLGIGGTKEIEMRKQAAAAYKQNALPAETFKTKGGLPLESAVNLAVSGGIK